MAGDRCRLLGGSFFCALHPLGAARLIKGEGQREAGKGPALTLAAAYRVLQQGETLQVTPPETRDAEAGRGAFGTRHRALPVTLVMLMPLHQTRHD
jgi:hypothetical protein